MDPPKLSSFLFLAAITLCIASSDAHTFDVGGKHGWIEHPKEPYSEWAEKHTFAVNDELFFKYKHDDSVLQVSKEAFDTCNTSAPIWKEEDGESFFTLNKTGPCYFIGGNKDHCDNGQKLLVNVTSDGKPPSPSPSPGHPGSPPPPPAPTPAPSAASVVLGTPAFAVALMGFVLGLIVIF